MTLCPACRCSITLHILSPNKIQVRYDARRTAQRITTGDPPIIPLALRLHQRTQETVYQSPQDSSPPTLPIPNYDLDLYEYINMPPNRMDVDTQEPITSTPMHTQCNPSLELPKKGNYARLYSPIKDPAPGEPQTDCYEKRKWRLMQELELNMLQKKKRGTWNRKVYSGPEYNTDIFDNGYKYTIWDRWGGVEPYTADLTNPGPLFSNEQ